MIDVPLGYPASAPVRLVRGAIDLLERIPYSLIALIARLAPAGVFWRSGQTKVEGCLWGTADSCLVKGWRLSDTAVDLFRDEYKVPLIDPSVAAHVSTFAEHLAPILLVLGLASRFSALALLIMTLVIEIFVYPDAWPTHGTWAVCFLLIMWRGPGVLSLDHLIARRYE